MRFNRSAVFAVAALVAAGAAAAPPPADANWLTRLGRIAGEGSGAGKAAKFGTASLDSAAQLVKSLALPAKGTALAAHAMPEGHWRFVNRQGEVFTAGTPAEMARVLPTLAPEMAAEGKLALYLTEETVFQQRALLKDLPKGAELHVVVDANGYKLVRHGTSGSEALHAEVKPNVLVKLAGRTEFDEAVWQLARSLNKSSIRMLSIEPGGGAKLSSVPRLDPATRAPQVDRIDPASLAAALPSLRGQTALVTGRVDGTLIAFKPTNGAEIALPLKTLAEAAAASDVNLVILQSATPRQPGGRNWFWQRIAVSGLDEAMKRATLSDFLNTLAASRGQIVVSASLDTPGRVTLKALPAGPASVAGVPVPGRLADWIGDATSHVTGNVATSMVEAHLRDSERQKELDQRLIPGIPTLYQFLYLGGLVAGVFGFAVARQWWSAIWPSERREEYAGAFGYHAARAMRLLAFLLIFLPLAGLPAMLVGAGRGLLAMVLAPIRLAARLFGRSSQTG